MAVITVGRSTYSFKYNGTDEPDQVTGRPISSVWTAQKVMYTSSRCCSELNEHFGSPQDLFELSAALHARGMYLMVDVVSWLFATVML